jgi:hypothetical protein
MAKLCKSTSYSSGRVWAKKWYTFDYEILQWNGRAPKKKLRGFPHVFTLENLKTAFMGDLKLWWSRHRRSESKVERKMKDAKANVSHDKTKTTKTVRRRELPCVYRSGRCIAGESFAVGC